MRKPLEIPSVMYSVNSLSGWVWSASRRPWWCRGVVILLLKVVLYCVACMLLELSVYECICTCPHGELSLICQRLYSKRWGRGGGEREREDSFSWHCMRTIMWEELMTSCPTPSLFHRLYSWKQVSNWCLCWIPTAMSAIRFLALPEWLQIAYLFCFVHAVA